MNRSLSLVALLFACAPLFGQNKPKEPVDEDPGDVLPVLIRGPYLQCATPVSVLVRWRTDALCRSRVAFGSSPSQLTGHADDSALVTEHKVLLTGLRPATTYYYSIGAIKGVLQGDSDNHFRTLPEPGTEGVYRIAALGDCGNNSVNQRHVRDQLLRHVGPGNLDAWILLGDNTYPDGTDAEFQTNFFNIYRDNLLKNYPLFPAPGNHDYHDKEFSSAVAQQTHEVAYYENFSMPKDGQSGGVPSHTASYYSFDIGTVHFLSLDSYGKEGDRSLYDTLGPQVEWVKKDLAQPRPTRWVVAYWHHPPFTKGSHDCDKEDDLVKIRENFIRILERNGVDLVLCGHSHDYERSGFMQGFYGPSAAFDAAKFQVIRSSGRNDGSPKSEPYVKKGKQGRGTVYVVSGSAGKLGGRQPDFPHKAMVYSDDEHGGASLLEFSGNKLDFSWICADGEVRDRFTMIKTP